MIERKISATSHGKPQIFLETGGGFKAKETVWLFLGPDKMTLDISTKEQGWSDYKRIVRRGRKGTLIIQLTNDFEVGEYVDLDQTWSYAIIHRRTGKDKYRRLGNAKD